MKMTAPFIKLKTPISEYSLVCRGCLADSGEMKNLREWSMIEDFSSITNVKMCESDGLSELLCTSCEDALMMCKRFRTQCLQSDITLRNVMMNKNEECNTNTITTTFSKTTLTFTIVAPNMEEKIKLTCPYNCSESYIKKKDLLQHLIKRHNTDKNFQIDTKYYCNFENCAYNVNGKKSFSERKFLNQHFNKVHRSKSFQCDICDSCCSTVTEFNRHLKTCNVVFKCEICNVTYKNNERLLVHLMRRHPVLHEEYKNNRKAEKRKLKTENEAKKAKMDNYSEYLIDSPKRSFATQTLNPKETVKNDVTLASWSTSSKTDEISTQTVFEDLLSLKSQNSEDESIFFSETVSLSDIQTQTFPEFGLNRSNKETLTDNQIDQSIKSTQTCFCNFRAFGSVSPSSSNLTSTETQTAELSAFKYNGKSDVLLSFNSAETQTCFENDGTDL